MFDIDDFPYYRDSVLVKRFEDFLSINPEGQDAWVDITDPINWAPNNKIEWSGSYWRALGDGLNMILTYQNEMLKNFFPYGYRFTFNTGNIVFVVFCTDDNDEIYGQLYSTQEFINFPDVSTVFKTQYGYGYKLRFSTEINPTTLQISKIEYRRIPFPQDFDWAQIWNVDVTSLSMHWESKFFIMGGNLFYVGAGSGNPDQYNTYLCSFENGSWTKEKIIDTVDSYTPLVAPFIYNNRKAVITVGDYKTTFAYEDSSFIWQSEDAFAEVESPGIQNLNVFVDTSNNILCIVNLSTALKLYRRTPLGVWTRELIVDIGARDNSGSWTDENVGTFAVDGDVHIAYYSDVFVLEYITNTSGSWVTTHVDTGARGEEEIFVPFQPQITLQDNGYPIILYSTSLGVKLATFNGASWDIIDFPIQISYQLTIMRYISGKLYILADETRFIIYDIATAAVIKSDFVYPERRYFFAEFCPPIQNLEKTDFYIPINYSASKYLIYKRGTGTYQSQNSYWKKIGLDRYILHADAPGTIIMAVDLLTSGHLWLSSNSGDNWRDITPSQIVSREESIGSSWCDSTATVMVCAPVDSVYFYLSTNGGTSWTEYNVSSLLNLISITRVYCGLGNGAIIIVAEDTGPNTGRIYRLLSGVWTNITPSPEPINGWTSIDFDTSGLKLVMATGERLLVSDNQGTSWVDRTPVGITDVVDVSCDSTGDKIVFRETVLYKSLNRGLSWSTNEFAGHSWDDTTVPKGKISKDGTSIFVTLFYGSTLYLSNNFGTTFDELPLPNDVLQEAQAWNSYLNGDGTVPFVNYSSALYKWSPGNL